MSDNGEIKLDGHMPNSHGNFNDEDHAWLGWINRSDENKPGCNNTGYGIPTGGTELCTNSVYLISEVLSAHFKNTNSDFTAKDWNDLIEWISLDEEKWYAVSERLRLEREERELAHHTAEVDKQRCVDCGRRTDFGTGSKSYLESVPYDKYQNWLGHPRRSAWIDRVSVKNPEKGLYATGPWRCGGDQLESCKEITASKEE